MFCLQYTLSGGRLRWQAENHTNQLHPAEENKTRMTYVATLGKDLVGASSTLDGVTPLDFRSPYDELRELRSVLTIGEIAELTGLRRETVSRARPDSRFRRRTEKALADLYAVVSEMRSTTDGRLGQLAPVLRRPQPLLGDRSIAELIKEGKTDLVLEYLVPSVPGQTRRLDEIHLDPDVLAVLGPVEGTAESSAAEDEAAAAEARRAAELIDADPELASRLPMIEEKIRDHFGAKAGIERAVVIDRDDPDGVDHLYLRVRTDLPVEAEIDRLAELLDQERDLLAPLLRGLTIGTL